MENNAIFKAGQWDMFKLISSIYLGKEYYFEQDDGTVYSRLTCSYLPSKEMAINEFLNLIDENQNI